MAGRLEGKVVLVVGGGSRFGQAVAVALAREGAAVAVGCGDEASGCAAVALVEAERGRAHHVILDPLDPESCRAAVDWTLGWAPFGREQLDALVTRVVSPPRQRKPLGDITADEWRDTFAHAVDAAVNPIRHAQAAMARLGGGSIVVIGSGAALAGVPDAAAFSAASGALASLTRALAAENQAGGVPVRVNCLALGVEPTPPAEVAPQVVFLASDESRHVNGQVVAVGD